MRNIIRLALLVGLTLACATHAEAAGDVVKIGVLNDQTGMNADLSGQGSVIAARMAAEDAGGKVIGKKIEVVFADHQNKADVGSSIATQWYDKDGVDVIADLPFSSVALAVQEIARQRQKIVLFSGPGSSDLTGKACSPFGFHWTFDTVALARGTGSAVVKSGGDTWFFLVADYAFGHALAKDTIQVVRANGGKVLGQAIHPVNTSDFSSYLVQAQASGAKVIGLANGATDTTNAIKQAHEFGITQAGQKLAGLLVFITDVHSLGLEVAQGLQMTESFYWNMDDQTRAFSKRYAERMNGRMPSMVQAGVYSAVAHYLKAVAAAGTLDGPAVAAKMHELPVNDFMSHNVHIRRDGRVMRDFYLFEVKSPAESKGEWDYYKLVRTIPAEEAARPEAEGNCPLVK
ncbi:MAG: ABC transporter substrate-binding protein [Alphaproteobacteria bacterium]|nr:ABC transporter substrate-binding protein [Alphaproteobacteria bacterium]